LTYYLKARELIENNPEDISENWNYLCLLVVIGQSYYYLHDYTSAKSVYDRTLELEPGFLYVSIELYPQLLKKMGNM
jgi:tetratricopeptide (TPR) repeat protein